MTPVIPSPDPIPLPGPVWLIEALLVGTFVLHVVPMNLVLGGSLLAGWSAWRGRAGDAEARARAALLAKLLPIATAFAINLGIAPLLFLQVLYGQAFYASSVLMGWSWIAVIVLLMAGYYGTYGFALSLDKAVGRAVVLALGSAGIFLLIGFVFTNNMTLMLSPERWHALYSASDAGLHLNLDDPTLLPRYAHFVVASFAVTGIALALLGRARGDGALGGFGARLFTVSTAVQLATGITFLLSLPERVRGLFTGGSAGDTALLWSAVALALVAVALVRGRPGLSAGALGLTLLGMATVRHRVREASLAPDLVIETLAVQPQTSVFLLFLVLLIAGIATVAWMARRFAQSAPTS